MKEALNPAWLRSFVAICETGSFTRARTRQPSVTHAGIKVLAHAREMEQRHQRLRLALADHDSYSGAISIASPGSIGLCIRDTALPSRG